MSAGSKPTGTGASAFVALLAREGSRPTGLQQSWTNSTEPDIVVTVSRVRP